MVRYQVFLSFRGPDTRHNLVQYLLERLTHLEVEVFLDCEEIHYGDSIRTSIKAAIEDSDICVPIFSANFASSPACLMEVAQMVELHKKIHPIFFFVKPGDVLHQRGTYGKSFAEHKSKYPESIIKNWEEALKSIPDKRGLEFKKDDLEDALKDALEAALGEFGDIKGTESKKAALEAAVGGINGRFYDALFSRFRELEVFISDLWKHLRDGQGGTQNLVGIDGHVSKMMQKLGFNYQDGRVVEGSERSRRWVVAVGGLPGVGKTTLAKEIYNKIRHLFYSCSFLENVREEIKEKGLVSVQKKLICDLKRGEFQEVQSSGQISKIMQHRFTQDRVLIVLDDVDDSKQIEPLAKELTWFGRGSRIILTTRKNDVIKHHKRDPEKNEVIDEYEVSTMQPTHALELFYKHAFQEDPAREGYDTLSSEITKAVGYLPFAIEIVGKYLYRKSKYTWMDTPSKLKERGKNKWNQYPRKL